MRNLGLIGGLGPLATIHYYRELARAEAGEMLIVHADMDRAVGHVQCGDRSGLADYFARLIERLAHGGAELAAISAVTPHICIRELEKISGAARFVELARRYSGGEVWLQDFLQLQLPPEYFDGIFANASLFHVPSQELPRVLKELWATLKAGGVLFSSNPRGDNEEGWSGERRSIIPRRPGCTRTTAPSW